MGPEMVVPFIKPPCPWMVLSMDGVIPRMGQNTGHRVTVRYSE